MFLSKQEGNDLVNKRYMKKERNVRGKERGVKTKETNEQEEPLFV